MKIGAMSIIRTAYRNELAEFRAARASGDYVGAWQRLERGHIIAQGSLPLLSFDRERGGRARLGFNIGQPRTFGVTARQTF